MKSMHAIAFAIAIGATASAQEVQRHPRAETERAIVEHQIVEGGMRPRISVEARVTKDAPYSAEAVTDFQQVLGDGNRIARRTVTKVFRDREGRTRRETTFVEGGREQLSIALGDPVAKTSWVLNPDTRTAYKNMNTAFAFVGVAGGAAVHMEPPTGDPSGPTRRHAEATTHIELSEASKVASGSMRAAAERTASGEGTTAREDLGEKVIDGVTAKGTRTTTVIAAGAQGNEQPITIVSEQWFSPDLQLLVMTRHNDPRTGETTYRLTNIVRAEPDRSLFEVPADYTVRDVQEHIVPRSPREPER